jgi:hypothetical protein
MWKTHAQAFYWKYRRFNLKEGKSELKLVQGGLRPSVLGAYEYVFPKEALAEVCNVFGITQNQQYGFGKIGLYTRHFCLRKIFGCRKIPKDILEKSKLIPPTFSTEEFERGVMNCILPGVAIHTIGIKDDPVGELGGYIQELF